MADIFVSYAREDIAEVECLVAALRAGGRSVWYDQAIRGGADFGEETTRALDAAKVVVVVWSKASIVSKWVRDEASVGRDSGTLIPISIDGVPPPLGFRQIQSIDFCGWTGDPVARSFQLLVEALLGQGDRPNAAPAFTPKATTVARSRRTRVFAAAVIAVVIGAGAAFLLRQHPSPERQPPISSSAETPPASIEKSVAVLPFLALSSGADDGYFTDGLSEQIIDSLATVPGLLVTARTSAFHFKGASAPIADIAHALGVEHVVEGSVRRAGDRLRISAQLIRASDGFHLWSKTYDRPAGDIFGVQLEIADRVAGALGVLLDEKQRRAMSEQGVRDVDAYASYHKGAQLVYEARAYGPRWAKLKEAQPYLESAYAAAPDFAQARLMHAVIYDRLLLRAALGAPPPKEFPPLPAQELQRLLLDDLTAAERDARTPGRRAMISYARTISSDDWTGLAVKMDAALASKECLGNLGWINPAALFGRLDAAVRFIKRRQVCDPFDPGAYGTIMDLHMFQRDFDATRADIEKGRALFGPRPPYAYSEFFAAVGSKRFADARRYLAALDAEPMEILLLGLQEGDKETAAAAKKKITRDVDALLVAAWTGDRGAAMRIAGDVDKRPFGYRLLMDAAYNCLCGSPFPSDATPNFAKRLASAGLRWAPPSALDWPDKDW